MANLRRIYPKSTVNQYRGINAHVNDYLQRVGAEREEFHSRHIVHMQDALNAVLFDMGYVAKMVPGLQIRPQDGSGRWSTPEPDLTIWAQRADPKPVLPIVPSQGSTMDAELSIPVLHGKSLQEYYAALQIYDRRLSWPDADKPVAHIELLSPSNKPLAHPPDSEAIDLLWLQYERNRLITMTEGIVLVEIDYFDQSLPLPGLTPYHPIPSDKVSGLHPPEGKPGAPLPFPYTIVVSNPNERSDARPYGVARVYGFAADTPMPPITIPLLLGESIEISLQAAYDQTIGSTYLLVPINYAYPPIHYRDYRPFDQDRIAARLLTLFDAARDGLLNADQPSALPLNYPIEGAADLLKQRQLEMEDIAPTSGENNGDHHLA